MTKIITEGITTFDLKQNLSNVWNEINKPLVLDHLMQEGEAIANACLSLCSTSNEALKQPLLLSNEEKFFHYRVVHEWMNEVKHFMVAWRDITFEQYKGEAFLHHKKTTLAALVDFKDQSKELMDEAGVHLTTTLMACKIEEQQINSTLRKQLKSYINLKSPHDIYAKQIQDLVHQCQLCGDNLAIFLTEKSHLQDIQACVEGNIKSILTQVFDFEQVLQELIKNLTQSSNTDPKTQIQILANAESKINFDNLQTEFNIELESLLKKVIQKIDLPIYVQVGTMVRREVSLNRGVKRWIESEVMPLLYEIWEIRNRLVKGGKLIFMNLKNQLNILIAQNEQTTVVQYSVSTTLITDSFLAQMKKQMAELDDLQKTIRERLEQKFQLHYIFDPSQHYLHLPAQTSIHKLIFKQNDLVDTVKKSLRILQKKLEQYQLSFNKNSDLSTPEHVVRYIRNKKGNGKNDYYQNIFLTKGYVGEAFWVGQEEKISRVAQVVENWKTGFRGAILLTGKRLSGKSLFGEIIVNRHFPNQAIHLSPDARVKIGKETIQTTYDLAKALELIQQHADNQPYCIWIDNLEMWWDVNITASQNIRALTQFMDTHCNELFFIIATSDTYKAHIANAHAFDQIFQAEINIGAFTVEDLEMAISIRHGATHKTLIDKNQEALSSLQFKKIVKKIHREAHGNIGEALFLWSNTVEAVNENDVISSFNHSYAFPDIFTPHTATLLTSIVLQKRTNEYRLQKLFGPAYQTKYASLVKQLLSLGLLTKKMGGWLEVNEVVVYEVIEMLRRKKYLL